MNDLLTEKQHRVLALMAEGLSNKEIGKVLWLEESTIKLHVHNILTRLEAKNRTHAVAIALRNGLLGGINELEHNG